jgi:hypothetical protein
LGLWSVLALKVYANTTNSKKFQNLKCFWSQAFQKRDISTFTDNYLPSYCITYLNIQIITYLIVHIIYIKYCRIIYINESVNRGKEIAFLKRRMPPNNDLQKDCGIEETPI